MIDDRRPHRIACPAINMECVEAKDPPIRTRTSAWGETLTRFKTEADPTGEKQRASVIEQFLS